MSDEFVDNAYAFLRSRFTADIRFDEHVRKLRYVIAPDGRLVLPVMVAMLQAVDTVLCVPEDVDDAMELLVTLEPFEERGPEGAAADRWRIYHGEPQDVRWAFASIDTARFSGMVIDGEALLRENTLAADEPALCRDANQRVDDLRAVCSRFAQPRMDIEQPLMVGIDASGFDVRASFDVVRVPFAQPVRDAAEARRELQRMVDSAK